VQGVQGPAWSLADEVRAIIPSTLESELSVVVLGTGGGRSVVDDTVAALAAP
jgi:hypothetical protein